MVSHVLLIGKILERLSIISTRLARHYSHCFPLRSPSSRLALKRARMAHHHHHPDPSQPLVPAMSAPPGETSDLLNHDNPLWKFNIVTQTTCLAVAGILFFLRCYVRLGFSRIPKQWILEDCTLSSPSSRFSDIPQDGADCSWQGWL